MIVWVYTRWGQQKGALRDVQEFVHSDEINGNDTVTVITPEIKLRGSREIIKGDRLVWRDLWSEWHEHVVGQLDTIHADGAIYHTIYAENSLCELMTDYVDERNSYGFSNSVALTRLLENTRWSVGTTDYLGTGDIKFYHTSAYDGLTAIIDQFGGEVTTTITVGASGVTSRKVNHLTHRGQDKGLLFVYGYDMDSVSREVSLEEVYTRIHCFGKGEETYNDEGVQTGYGRRLTFADINGGHDYVEDDNAMASWGLPSANGSRKHSEGVFVWEDCEDAQELLKLGREKLDEVKEPHISYSATVAVLADAGLDFKNARPGDTCTLRDKPLDARLSGRVTKVVRYYVSDQATQITVGNITRNISDVLKSQKDGLDFIHSRAISWDGAANAAPGFLEQLQKNLNNAFDVGGSYYNSSFELGSIWCSVPLAKDADGNVLPRPSVTVDDEGYPPMAIQLKGGGFRIANSLTSTGDFDWRTFGTGRGFTADEINAGIIRGGSNYWNLETGDLYFKQGSIQCANGAYWNIGNGDFETIFTIKESLRVGSSTVSTYLQDVLCVDMDTRTPFGVYRGSREKYVDARTGEVTYSSVTDKSLVGGTVLSDDKSEVYFRGTRVGISDTNYITTGVTTDGFNGASFLSRGTEYLAEVALYASDDPAKATSGVGFRTCGRTFMDASSYSGYRHVRIFVPTTNDFVDTPSPSLYLASPNTSAARVSLTRNSSSYLNIASDRLSLMYATGKYMSIDDTAARLVYAVDGNGNITNGVYLSSSSSSFIHSSAQRLNISSTSTYLQHSSSRELRLSSSGTYLCDAVDSDNNITRGIYFSSSSTTLKHSASRQLVMDSNGVSLRYSSTNYITINGSYIIVRNGNHGMRYDPGATSWVHVTFD